VAEEVDRLSRLEYMAAYARQVVHDKPIDQERYISRYGQGMLEIRD